MSLYKLTIIDQITVTELGIVLVRKVTKVMENGKELSRAYQRNSFAPDEDVSEQPANVKAICFAAWTQDIVAAYRDAQVTQASV
jgi:hypothetical protein